MDEITAARLDRLLADYVDARLPQTDEFSPIEAERRDLKAHDAAEQVCDLLVRFGTRQLAEAVR